ncbi:AraC family transcriptional regulator [bacterium]|nr:MAG: AraC family transcriptional regulator [bacterium]
MRTSPIDLDECPQLAACARNVHYSDESYRLAQHWSLHFYQYHAQLLVDGEPFEIRPGCVSLVPPDSSMEYHFKGPSTHFYAHFTLPEPSEATTSIPIFTDLGPDFLTFETQIQAVADTLPLYPKRAEVKLWDLLFDLAAREPAALPARHPSLEKAMSLIELRLGEEISITALAREVGLSHNQLTRLFRQATGRTVVAYIRGQRAARAKHLLRHSTLPLKAVAVQIGAADLPSFSVLMKRETGQPPGYWRRLG